MLNASIDTFRKLPKDSTAKIIVVAFTISLICSSLVSTVTVLLKPTQIANKEREQQQYLLEIIERQPGIKELFDEVGAQYVEAKIVDLATGQYHPVLNPDTYDVHKAARDPNQSVAISHKHDIAKIKRRAKYAPVYLVRQNDAIKFVILPIYGKGFASMLYGYLGLAADTNTVIGLNFYEHSETPGLGGRVSNRAWLDQWRGKRVRDPEGKLSIGVARGKVAPDSPVAAYEVDGISGATWTSRSVHNLVRFWLGDQGFGPYLQQLGTLERE